MSLCHCRVVCVNTKWPIVLESRRDFVGSHFLFKLLVFSFLLRCLNAAPLFIIEKRFRLTMQGQPVSVNISINQSNQNGSLPLGAQVILKMNDAITMNSVGKTPFFYYFMSVRINLFDKRLIVREFRFLTH